ncbi:MAG: recombinase family protein [Planctomycetes bacterium]|nr:recombinase family protein [Planctomycetota bacterium]
MTPEMNRIEGNKITTRGKPFIRVPEAPRTVLPVQETTRQTSAETRILGLDTWLRCIQEGKRQAARAGRHQGGITPYGYRKNYDPLAKRFILDVDQYQASIVRTIFREYLRLKSLGKVSARLAELNIPAPACAKALAGRPNGAGWSRATLNFILGNTIYLGNVKYGAIENKGEHAPIIAPIIFNKVQKIKETNRRSGRLESTVGASVPT